MNLTYIIDCISNVHLTGDESKRQKSKLEFNEFSILLNWKFQTSMENIFQFCMYKRTAEGRYLSMQWLQLVQQKFSFHWLPRQAAVCWWWRKNTILRRRGYQPPSETGKLLAGCSKNSRSALSILYFYIFISNQVLSSVLKSISLCIFTTLHVVSILRFEHKGVKGGFQCGQRKTWCYNASQDTRTHALIRNEDTVQTGFRTSESQVGLRH